MVDLPMKIDRNTIALALHYLKRVTPAGHFEQEQLFQVINRLQTADQMTYSYSKDSSRCCSCQPSNCKSPTLRAS